MIDDTDSLEFARLIWWVSLAALPLYLVVCHVFGARLAMADDSAISVMQIRTVFFAATIWFFACMNVFRSSRASHGSENEPAQAGTNAGKTKKFLMLRGYSGSILICMAYSETIALFGVILCLLGDDQRMVYLFCAIAAMAIIIFRPNPIEFEKYQDPHTVN